MTVEIDHGKLKVDHLTTLGKPQALGLEEASLLSVTAQHPPLMVTGLVDLDRNRFLDVVPWSQRSGGERLVRGNTLLLEAEDMAEAAALLLGGDDARRTRPGPGLDAPQLGIPFSRARLVAVAALSERWGRVATKISSRSPDRGMIGRSALFRVRHSHPGLG